MHLTALQNGKLFFETYTKHLKKGTVIDIGAQDFNGSLKLVCPEHLTYIGVDLEPGKGVDIVLENPYKLPFDNDSVDIICSSSCFEHTEFFWESFLEVLRVLKPEGLFYLNAPSNGPFHQYPMDFWRFYPQSGISLVNWAKKNSYQPMLLESYISHQYFDCWNDFTAVFLKDDSKKNNYTKRILHSIKNFYNGIIDNNFNDIINHKFMSQDQSTVSWFFKKVKWKLLTLIGLKPTV